MPTSPGGPVYVQCTDDGVWLTIDRATGKSIARFDGPQAALDSLLDLAAYADALSEPTFYDAHGKAAGVFRWLDASAEEPSAQSDGSQVTAPRIRSMIDQRNGAGEPCMIDGGGAAAGGAPSGPHQSAVHSAARANGWAHVAAEWREPGGRVHLALYAELHPDIAPDVESGRLAKGSILFGQSTTDPNAARLFTHALTNMPIVAGLVPSSAFRSLTADDSLLFARAQPTRTIIMKKIKKSAETVTPAVAEAPKAERAASFMDTIMAACAEVCAACAEACQKCADAATKAGDAALAQACASCAAACSACAEACKSGDMAACVTACEACASACESCESACEASELPAAKACAKACAECYVCCEACGAGCAAAIAAESAPEAEMAADPAAAAPKAEDVPAPETPRAAPTPEEALAFMAEALPILADALGAADASPAAVLDAIKVNADKIKGAMAAAGTAPADGLPSDGSAPARAQAIGLEAAVATLTRRTADAEASLASMRAEVTRRDLRDAVAKRFGDAKLVLADAARDELVDMAMRAPEQDRAKLIDMSLRAANVPPAGRAITDVPAPRSVAGGDPDPKALLEAATEAVEKEHPTWTRAAKAAEVYKRSRAALVEAAKSDN